MPGRIPSMSGTVTPAQAPIFTSRSTPELPAVVRGSPIAKAAGIGAGTLGGGLAICFANAGLPVTLIDSSREALERGLAAISNTYESMVKRGRITSADKTLRMALIQG